MQNLLAEIHPNQWTLLWDCAHRHLDAPVRRRVDLGGGLVGRAPRLPARSTACSRVSRAWTPRLRPVLCDTSLWGIRVVAIIGALSQLGIQTASIVAVLGAAGLAIGLALQGTMQNIAAGIMLLLLRPFKVGDSIEAGNGTVAGTRRRNQPVHHAPHEVRWHLRIRAEQRAVEQFDPQLQPQSDAPPRSGSGNLRARRRRPSAGRTARPRRRRPARAAKARASSDGDPFRRQHRGPEHPCLGQSSTRSGICAGISPARSVRRSTMRNAVCRCAPVNCISCKAPTPAKWRPCARLWHQAPSRRRTAPSRSPRQARKQRRIVDHEAVIIDFQIGGKAAE